MIGVASVTGSHAPWSRDAAFGSGSVPVKLGPRGLWGWAKTGSADDGISVGYGAHDVTIQHCFLAGNTRSIFMKYGATTNVSIHHTWIQKQWVRGPLVSQSVFADIRNVIVEDWTLWGTRFEKDASGNVVDSLFILSPYAKSVGGKPNSPLDTYRATLSVLAPMSANSQS